MWTLFPLTIYELFDVFNVSGYVWSKSFSITFFVVKKFSLFDIVFFYSTFSRVCNFIHYYYVTLLHIIPCVNSYLCFVIFTSKLLKLPTTSRRHFTSHFAFYQFATSQFAFRVLPSAVICKYGLPALRHGLFWRSGQSPGI